MQKRRAMIKKEFVLRFCKKSFLYKYKLISPLAQTEVGSQADKQAGRITFYVCVLFILYLRIYYFVSF